MLMIRLQRVGRKNDPSFRVVLTDKRNAAKSGKFLEVLGHHDFRGKSPADNHLDAERIKHLISRGAQPSQTVHNLLVEYKVLAGKKINVLPRKSPIKKEEVKKGSASSAAAPAEGGEKSETPKTETPAAEEKKS